MRAPAWPRGAAIPGGGARGAPAAPAVVAQPGTRRCSLSWLPMPGRCWSKAWPRWVRAKLGSHHSEAGSSYPGRSGSKLGTRQRDRGDETRRSPQLKQSCHPRHRKARAHKGPAAYANNFPVLPQSRRAEVHEDEKASKKCQDPSSFPAQAAVQCRQRRGRSATVTEAHDKPWVTTQPFWQTRRVQTALPKPRTSEAVRNASQGQRQR